MDIIDVMQFYKMYPHEMNKDEEAVRKSQQESEETQKAIAKSLQRHHNVLRNKENSAKATRAAAAKRRGKSKPLTNVTHGSTVEWTDKYNKEVVDTDGTKESVR